MTTSDRPESLFARAESGSRQLVLQIGLGIVCFTVGMIMGNGAATRIAERVGLIESESLAWAIDWLLRRLWLFALLPFAGWAIGRFTPIKPLRFTLIAGLSGELFGLLLIAGIDGFEVIVDQPREVVARVLTFFVGLAIVAAAVQEGRATAAQAQRDADAIAEKNRAALTTPTQPG